MTSESTTAAVNETVITITDQLIQAEAGTDFVLLFYLRIVFYVFVVIKIVEILFMRKRQFRIHERIQRKFLFSHGMDMIKNFTPEEMDLMSLTLQNTLQNAMQPISNNPSKSSMGKVKKNVSFI